VTAPTTGKSNGGTLPFGPAAAHVPTNTSAVAATAR
jgi:hypothetical protein